MDVLTHKRSVKQVVRAGSVVISGEQLNINANEKQGCFMEILEQIKAQMDAMLSYHSRILLIRLELHVNESTQTNELVSDYFRKLVKRLKYHYKTLHVGYLWVREQKIAKQQHYHYVLILDANKVNHPSRVIELAYSIWSGWDQPIPKTPKNCYYRIDRKSGTNYQEAFYRASYLAKERGKGYKAKTANDYSGSRLKPKQLTGRA